MNILHQKSWHVRTKENIARVRRDEENARKEEEERMRRVAVAESEHRTNLLRDRALKRKRNDDEVYEDETLLVKSSKPEHLNFFQQFEEGEKVSKTNVDYEREKKEEKEKQEKAIGLLTYLGKSAIESQNETPWYKKPPEPDKSDDQLSAVDIVKNQKSLKRKAAMDPMLAMNNFLEAKRKADDLASSASYDRRPAQQTSLKQVSAMSPIEEDEHVFRKKKSKHKKSKKEKKTKKDKKVKKHDKEKKHKKCKHRHRSPSPEPVKTESKSLQQLRNERLKREQEERKRTQELLARAQGIKLPDNSKKEEVVEYDDRRRSYNSQYNPDFARRPGRSQVNIDEFVD